MNPKRLFTPGPLTTSRRVKESMLVDLGSRDPEFIGLIREIRAQLLALGGASKPQGYEAVLVQGSGTFGVEAVLSSILGPRHKLLLLVNGAYGERMVQIAMRHQVGFDVLRWPEDQPTDEARVQQRLAQDPSITHVAMVHCETTTGILNPVGAVGALVRSKQLTFVVDAMSSFGAIPTLLPELGIDFLISSANKCIEGVPGFSFVLARRENLEAARGLARTLSLDLYEQWRGLEDSGQFRFTPPTHALVAFAQALRELQEEGGVEGRARRYQANHQALIAGMRRLGFKPYLEPAVQSCIITAFHYPPDPRFRFEEFYRRLTDRQMVIYPGKLGRVDCFRIGTIGHLTVQDVEDLLEAIGLVLKSMEIQVPLAPP